MGSVLGKDDLEKPKYDVVEKGAEYEIRQYAPYVVAEVTFNGTHFKSGQNGGFMTLANYIGVVGKANNVSKGGDKAEKVAMTAPVITYENAEEEKSEKIAMTAPVITSESKGDGSEDKKTTTMQFALPSKYTQATAPTPTDPRVSIKEVPGQLMGAITFSGFWNDANVEKHSAILRRALEACGWKIAGKLVLARYNPPFTPFFFRRNEVLYPVEQVKE